MKVKHFLLSPLSLFYRTGLFLNQKISLKKPPYIPEIPSIGVGNLRTGGAGKTPLVIYLAEKLVESYRVGIVTRGFKRKFKKDLVIQPGEEPEVHKIGDEPFLIYKKLHKKVFLLISANRLWAVQKAKELKLNALIFDDNFQYLRLRPHFQIVIILPEDIKNPYLLPLGKLREPLEALKRADSVLINFKEKKFDESLKIPFAVPQKVFRMKYYVEGLESLNGIFPPSTVKNQKAILVCGIAEPEGFVKTALALGIQIVGIRCYLDHHWYTKKEIQSLEKEMTLKRADFILTTEKDKVRFPYLPNNLMTLKIKVHIEQGKELLSEITRWTGLEFK